MPYNYEISLLSYVSDITGSHSHSACDMKAKHTWLASISQIRLMLERKQDKNYSRYGNLNCAILSRLLKYLMKNKYTKHSKVLYTALYNIYLSVN